MMELFKEENKQTQYFDMDGKKLKRIETRINGEVTKIEWLYYKGRELFEGQPMTTWDWVKNKKELEDYYKKNQ